MASRALAIALVAAYRALCAVTLHRWVAHPNEHGGKPMLRSCAHCGKRQTWNYRLARERGVIKWEDARGVRVGDGQVQGPEHASDGKGQESEAGQPLGRKG